MRASCLIGLLLVAAPLAAAESPMPVDRWQADMRRFDAIDSRKPPRPGGIVFVGSSSIRMWDLDQSFPDLNPINRGFGGSELADSVRHLDILVLRHKPRAVVLYAGDNDIAHGKTPDQVTKDFEAFVAGVRKSLPEAKIVYIAIKPSIARWKLAEPMRQANVGIKAVCDRTPGCEFVDIWPAMLDEKGEPQDDLFVWDGLHLSAEGYTVWTKLVRPRIE